MNKTGYQQLSRVFLNSRNFLLLWNATSLLSNLVMIPLTIHTRGRVKT